MIILIFTTRREHMPKTYDEFEASCRYLGIPFPTVFIYYACSKCDTLFRGATKDADRCTRCDEPRQEAGVGHKSRKYHYFSCIEFLHNIFSCKVHANIPNAVPAWLFPVVRDRSTSSQ